MSTILFSQLLRTSLKLSSLKLSKEISCHTSYRCYSHLDSLNLLSLKMSNDLDGLAFSILGFKLHLPWVSCR